MIHYKKLFLIFVILAIATISIITLNSTEKPSPATLKINEKEQISGISTYCWATYLKGTCVDTAGYVTPEKPLFISLPSVLPISATLHLPLKEPPQNLQLNIVRVTDKDRLKVDSQGFQQWSSKKGDHLILPLKNEQDIELMLEPGIYVLNVYAVWKGKGDVNFDFFIEVDIQQDELK